MNPLRIDPTRTALLRKKFTWEMHKRLNGLKQDIATLLQEGDLTFNAKWVFHSKPWRVKSFIDWMQTRVEQHLGSTEPTQEYIEEHLQRAYKQGLARTYESLKGAKAKAEFMPLAYKQDTVDMLTTRARSEIKGVTDSMRARMNTILIDGVNTDRNAREIAVDLQAQIERAKLTIKSTVQDEVARSYNEGTLDAMEALKIEKVGVAVEWETSHLGLTPKGNPSPCKLCAPLQGIILTVREARGMFPRHRGCLCTPVPIRVGDKDQIRSKRRIEAIIKKSVKLESPKSKIRKGGWGARKRISKHRPKVAR